MSICQFGSCHDYVVGFVHVMMMYSSVASIVFGKSPVTQSVFKVRCTLLLGEH